MLRKNGLNLNTPDRLVAKNIRIIKNIAGNFNPSNCKW